MKDRPSTNQLSESNTLSISRETYKGTMPYDNEKR